ncbi:MAG: class I SAM-dependent methyltransferase [Flavobacteriales bacterium]|nr:class I SAM-dependent methyltransferase [Flavobacteriales bacterium]
MDEHDWDRVAPAFEEEIFNVPANDTKGLIKMEVDRLSDADQCATDLGCGVGRTLALLARSFRLVYAVDISSECLSIARQRHKDQPNIRYVHADLSRAPRGFPATELVLCINTWLHGDLSTRLALIDQTCRSVKRGGHLLLIVPALGSALLTHFRRLQWELRDGTPPGQVHSVIEDPGSGIEHGIIHIDSVPTKHYLKEELEILLADRGLTVEATHKLEYGWGTEFAAPPSWMKRPFPWDWFVVARRVR